MTGLMHAVADSAAAQSGGAQTIVLVVVAVLGVLQALERSLSMSARRARRRGKLFERRYWELVDWARKVRDRFPVNDLPPYPVFGEDDDDDA